MRNTRLEAKTTSETKAKVMKGMAAVAVQNATEDEDLAKRATMYLGGKMLREQENREKVTQLAMGDLKVDPPKEDAPRDIDEDWLNVFGKLAESRSNDTMQAYFARILSGEIRRPGRFSVGTLEVLARMSRDDAFRFQHACSFVTEFRPPHSPSMRFIEPMIIAAPFEGSPGANGLAGICLPYEELCRLQESGLIQTDLTAYRHFGVGMLLGLDVVVGGKKIPFEPVEPNPSQAVLEQTQQAAVVHLTRAGAELQTIARSASS